MEKLIWTNINCIIFPNEKNVEVQLEREREGGRERWRGRGRESVCDEEMQLGRERDLERENVAL